MEPAIGFIVIENPDEFGVDHMADQPKNGSVACSVVTLRRKMNSGGN
jgi:hypothetical protein